MGWKMKRIYLIHRWDANPASDWYTWLKKQLEEKGFEIIIPKMPNTAEPKINAWISAIEKIIKNQDNDIYFIGHSIGCQAIMRYLEKTNINIAGTIFVAGWFKLDNLENSEVKSIAKPWMETPINFNKIKKQIKELIVILSDNEPYNFVEENSKKFKQELNAKIIIEKGNGHFTEDDGITELPIVLEKILEVIK
jgi:uncharacterized protein